MHLPEPILARLQRLTCLDSTTRVQFRLPDGSDFYLSFSPESAQQAATDADNLKSLADQIMGQAASADLELEMSSNTLEDIVEGRLSARHAFLLGDIRYMGNRELAARLADIFTVN